MSEIFFEVQIYFHCLLTETPDMFPTLDDCIISPRMGVKNNNIFETTTQIAETVKLPFLMHSAFNENMDVIHLSNNFKETSTISLEPRLKKQRTKMYLPCKRRWQLFVQQGTL